MTMDIQTEELKEEKNAVRKDQLLQKYGIIPPKLTPDERLEISLEFVEGAE